MVDSSSDNCSDHGDCDSEYDCDVLIKQDDFAEFFTVPRVLPYVMCLGLTADLSVDIKHFGGGVDLGDFSGRSFALNALDTRKPKLLGLSPPCTLYSKLYQLWNAKKVPAYKLHCMQSEADALLDLGMLCANVQVKGNRKFFFEHPTYASSWKRASVTEVADLIGVKKVHFDQCALGLKAPDGRPMKKRTTLMTNSIEIVNRFSDKQCSCSKKHCRIQGSQHGLLLSAYAAHYPPEMCSLLADAALEISSHA